MVLLFCLCGQETIEKNNYRPKAMQTLTKTVTRCYTVNLHLAYSDPDFGRVHAYDQIEVTVPQGYTPGVGGEIARVETYITAEYPGWEITQLRLTDDPDVEF